MNNLIGYVVPELSKEERSFLNIHLRKDAANYLTLCEQLRFIYDVVDLIKDEDIKEDLTGKLEVALQMARKMNTKMTNYQKRYNEASGSKGNNLIPLKFTEERKAIREKRT